MKEPAKASARSSRPLWKLDLDPEGKLIWAAEGKIKKLKSPWGRAAHQGVSRVVRPPFPLPVLIFRFNIDSKNVSSKNLWVCSYPGRPGGSLLPPLGGDMATPGRRLSSIWNKLIKAARNEWEVIMATRKLNRQATIQFSLSNNNGNQIDPAIWIIVFSPQVVRLFCVPLCSRLSVIRRQQWVKCSYTINILPVYCWL